MKKIASICLVSNTLYDQGIIQNSGLQDCSYPTGYNTANQSQIPV